MLSSGMLAGFFDPIGSTPFYYWQLPIIVLLVGVIIFWVRYRKSQM